MLVTPNLNKVKVAKEGMEKARREAKHWSSEGNRPKEDNAKHREQLFWAWLQNQPVSIYYFDDDWHTGWVSYQKRNDEFWIKPAQNSAGLTERIKVEEIHYIRTEKSLLEDEIKTSRNILNVVKNNIENIEGNWSDLHRETTIAYEVPFGIDKFPFDVDSYNQMDKLWDEEIINLSHKSLLEKLPEGDFKTIYEYCHNKGYKPELLWHRHRGYRGYLEIEVKNPKVDYYVNSILSDFSPKISKKLHNKLYNSDDELFAVECNVVVPKFKEREVVNPNQDADNVYDSYTPHLKILVNPSEKQQQYVVDNNYSYLYAVYNLQEEVKNREVNSTSSYVEDLDEELDEQYMPSEIARAIQEIK